MRSAQANNITTFEDKQFPRCRTRTPHVETVPLFSLRSRYTFPKALYANYVSKKKIYIFGKLQTCLLLCPCPFRSFKLNVKENKAAVLLSGYEKQIITS
jgi:hypothetical protein